MMISKATTLSVPTLALAVFTFVSPARAANQPVYDLAAAMTVSGIITAVSETPAGQTLEGVHILVKTKSGGVDVFLAPRNFLNVLKTSFAVGDYIDVTGSRVKAGNTEVVLAREVDDGQAIIMLRDSSGAEVWKNWGVGVNLKTT